mmetsp:Transcript_39540/g.122048  ORF Transcript_39540/g.122048 Transcript_39540/m.122048 type:complete len:147 (-) Transcript_39540:70-510(-)
MDREPRQYVHMEELGSLEFALAVKGRDLHVLTEQVLYLLNEAFEVHELEEWEQLLGEVLSGDVCIGSANSMEVPDVGFSPAHQHAVQGPVAANEVQPTSCFQHAVRPGFEVTTEALAAPTSVVPFEIGQCGYGKFHHLWLSFQQQQ